MIKSHYRPIDAFKKRFGHTVNNMRTCTIFYISSFLRTIKSNVYQKRYINSPEKYNSNTCATTYTAIYPNTLNQPIILPLTQPLTHLNLLLIQLITESLTPLLTQLPVVRKFYLIWISYEKKSKNYIFQ